jgi:hypothetical protein
VHDHRAFGPCLHSTSVSFAEQQLPATAALPEWSCIKLAIIDKMPPKGLSAHAGKVRVIQDVVVKVKASCSPCSDLQHMRGLEAGQIA